MTTGDHTVSYGITIVRLPNGARGNYEILSRHRGERLLTCGWISMGTGQPFAFGGDDGDDTPNPSAEFGGRIRVEPRGSGPEDHYAGARIHLLEGE